MALGLTAAAALGRFELQVCRDCGAVQYPPREACERCLSLRLDWKLQSGEGELLCETTLYHSNDEYFRERLPWRVGLVRLEGGPIVVAHLHGHVRAGRARVRIDARLDRAGQSALVAFPRDEVSSMLEDRQLREMTCDPKARQVLITDATSAVGQALVRAFLDAGASRVWAGCAGPSKKGAGLEDLARLERVAVLPLDVTNADSIKRAAAEMGGRVDILINSAEHHPAHEFTAPHGIDDARQEMEVNYFGLLRLEQEFGPLMRERGANRDGAPRVEDTGARADATGTRSAAKTGGIARTGGGEDASGPSSTLAWVNLLSVYALSNVPAHGTFSASKAAAHSLSQCQRAQMRAAGVRVVNVFPGPIDEDWSPPATRPKLSAEALARAVIEALREGIEDVYPGDVAAEWLTRWRENSKVLERELEGRR